MNLPTQGQWLTAARYAGTMAGSIGSAAALFGVMSQEQSATLATDLRAIIDDSVRLFGDISKFALFIIPFVTIWLAKIGFNSASPKSQIASVQALPDAQVTVTDPKLAEGIPGVKVVKPK